MLIYNVVFQAYSKLIQLYIYNFMYTTYIGEGNGNPLQYSCLENPVVRGAWQANIPWGLKESDTTEATWLAHTQPFSKTIELR